VNIGQRTRQQRRRSLHVANGRRLIQQSQDALLLGRTVFGSGLAVAGLVEIGKTRSCITHAPLLGRSGRAADDPADVPGRHPARSHQDNTRAVAHGHLDFVERAIASSTVRSSVDSVIMAAQATFRIPNKSRLAIQR